MTSTSRHAPKPCRGSRLALLALVVSLACAPAAQTPQPTSRPKRPNLILISIDTLRSDHLSCYGYDRPTSPFIDELATRGVRFANALVNTHGTTPSHATILSSVYQESHRVAYTGGTKDRVPTDLTWLPEILRREGYLTLAMTGGGNVGRKFGFARGFDEYGSAHSIESGINRLGKMLARHADDERPVFVFFHTYEVHSPYTPPSEYRSLFGEYESDFWPTSENLLSIAGDARAALSDEDLAFVVAMYDAGIRHTDRQLRRLFEILDGHELLENAVFVLTSDHGEEFAEHGGMLHRGLLYEELLRVPLIVGGGGVPAGDVESSLVSSVDIAPTLLACAGLEVPPQMQGRRLVCGGEGEDANDWVISQYGENRYSIRTPEWKFIESADTRQVELYDLAADPRETRNVFRENRPLVAKFRKYFKTWKERQMVVQRGSQAEVELDEKEIEQLKALGYLGGD